MDRQIIFGKSKLNIFYLTTQINVAFGKRKVFNEEHEKVCKIISKAIGKDFYDQAGAGKRVWANLNSQDLDKIRQAAKTYNSGS
jgi:hypothetical protein